MALFENDELEDFLLLIRDLNMTLKESLIIVASAKIQYRCTLVHGEALHQFYMFYYELGSTTSENLKKIILGLGKYFFLLMCCQNKSARYTTE